MNSKKAITLLVLVTMLMALVPLVPVHAAIEITDLELEGVPIAPGDDVQYGDELTVIGGGVTSGATVEVYWDLVQPWVASDAQGKIASGKAKADGTFSIDFDVPEGLAGAHYIWVKDVSTGATYGGTLTNGEVTVIAKLTATPSSGLKGDKVVLKGYGYGYNEDDDKGYDVTITFPATGSAGVALAAAPTTAPKTNSLGTWTYTLTISAEDYADDYPIDSVDTSPDTNADAIADFKVGASITLNTKEGPVGTVITITGRGFDKTEDVTVTIDGPDTVVCYIVSGGTVRSDGRISTKIVVPTVTLTNDEPTDYDIIVEDVAGGLMALNLADAEFTVNGAAEVKATPSYGPQGSQITVEGWNFSRISGTEVEVTLGGEGAKTLKTDNNGYFKGTFTIPAVASGDPVLLAETKDIDGENHGITAESTVRVGIMLTILTPSSGPSGALISVTGVGFTAGEPYTVYIGDDEWFTGTVGGGGTIGENDNVPTLEPGIYEITIIDEDTEIEVTAEFEVTEKTKVVTTPSQAPNEYEVKVEGWYFAESPADASLEFILFNATQEWILDAQYEAATVELEADTDWDAGYFEATFEMPDDTSISLGTYTLNVTDGEGMFAQTTIRVVEKTQSISPRKTVFAIGDTVSFNLATSFVVPDSYIQIYDPAGTLYWETDLFTDGVLTPNSVNKWITVGTVNNVPYYYQTAGGNPMVLLEDAPLGTYTWEFYDVDDDVIDEGTFTVQAAATDIIGEQVADLNNQIADLADQLTSVSSEFDDVKSDIADVAAIAAQAVAAAQQAAEAVTSVAQTANTASQAAADAATAANAARDAANGLTTLVYGAIGAALVAALAAIVSLMQISKRIAG